MTVRLPSPGDLFLDRYQLVRVVGYGGYGRIYEATQLDIGRRVALKVIAPPDEDEVHLSSETFAERFEREARAISALRDPHTVTMYDHGEHEGLLYMVLEFIDGKTLAQLTVDEGALAPDRVEAILVQVLHSLMEAHDHGLVHRDIKPSNIMVYEHMGRGDQAKLLDFGLVKSVHGEQLIDAENLTRADVLVGTPRYMSPEQVRQEPIGPATDIYSLGLVAYEMLTGAPLLTENQAMAVIARHISADEFDLDGVPGRPGLRRVLQKMLRKNPADRFASAADVLAGLDDPPEIDEDAVVPDRRDMRVPLIAVIVPILLFAVAVVAWPRPEPAPRPLVVEEQPDPPEVARPVPAAPAPVAQRPAINPAVVSAIAWSSARVGFAVDSASGAAQEDAEQQTRRRTRRRNRSTTPPPETGRNLRIFE